MKKEEQSNNKHTYWIYDLLQKGPMFILLVMVIFIIATTVITSIFVLILKLAPYNEYYHIFQDFFASVMNNWVPDFSNFIIYDETGVEIGHRYAYLIINTLGSIFGKVLSFTIIALISAEFLKKYEEIQTGSYPINEKDHIVVLGYDISKIKLIEQIIDANLYRKTCIVVASNMPKLDIENDISTHINVPKNIKVICRSIDITDKESLLNLSIVKAAHVVVFSSDDNKTIRSLFSINSICLDNDIIDKNVVSLLYNKNSTFALEEFERKNFSIFHVHELIARVIAHTCSSAGIGTAFSEMLDLKHSFFAVKKVTKAIGHTFKDLSNTSYYATPIGIYHDEITNLNPDKDYIINENDEIILFQSRKNISKSLLYLPDEIDLDNINEVTKEYNKIGNVQKLKKENYLIIGYNDTFKTIIEEIADAAKNIIVIGINKEEEEHIDREVDIAKHKLLTFTNFDMNSIVSLEQLVMKMDHVVILETHKDSEDSDTYAMLLLFKIRAVRKKLNLNFHIISEMYNKHNEKVMQNGDTTDFIVANNFSSMIASQLVIQPKLKGTIKDFLSTTGNELIGHRANEFLDINDEYDASDLRQIALINDSVFLGYIKRKGNSTNICLSPKLDDKVKFDADDTIILLAKVE